VRVQVVLHHPDLLGLGVMHVHQFPVVTPFTFRRNSCPDILLGCERPEGGGYGRA
jgi:hypothetical protein